MTHSLRRARVLALCGPLALGILVSAPRTYAQDAAPGTATASTTSWTTLRGDAQRTGSSSAQVTLPLSLGWRYTSDTQATTTTSSPIVLNSPQGQRVFFTVGAQVISVDAQTGAKTSGFNSPSISSTITAPLTMMSTDDGDFIIAASLGGGVDAFRTSDGGRAWEVEVPGGVSNGGPIIVQTASGQRIVVATDTGQIVAITPKGQIDTKWKASLGRYGNPPSTALALSENGSTLYAIATDGKMYYVDAKQGTLLRSVTLPSQTSVTPVVAGKNVVAVGVTRIAAFDAAGGAPAWSIKTNGTVASAPAYRVVDGVPTLFYGTTEGNFYAIDARDGSQEWKATPRTSFTGAPIVLENMVLVGTRSGSMLALNPKSGAVLWQYRLKTQRLTSNTGNNNGRGGFGGRGGGGGFRGMSGEVPGNGGATVQLVQRRGGGGGGFGGGGFGGFGRGGSSRTQQYSNPYSITAAPAVVNGQIFVQGDDAAIYGFTSQQIDADPPRVVEPSISVPDDQGNLTALLVSGNRPVSVPGVGPFYFAAQLDDVGSGIDPASLTLSSDGAPLDKGRVDFDVDSGVLTVTLADPAKGDITLPGGNKTITISMKDYSGNTYTGDFTFTIDDQAPAPSSNANGRNGRNGRNGNGFPGRGFPGGGPDDGGNPGIGGPDGGGPDGPDGGNPGFPGDGGPDGGGPDGPNGPDGGPDGPDGGPDGPNGPDGGPNGPGTPDDGGPMGRNNGVRG